MRKLTLMLAGAAVCAPLVAHADPIETRLIAGEVIETWNPDADSGALGYEVSAGPMRATLTDAAGDALADKTITFTTYPSGGCTAVTDAQGVATCGQDLGGYEAVFAGDEAYAPSSAAGCLVTMTGTINGCAHGGGYLLHLWVD